MAASGVSVQPFFWVPSSILQSIHRTGEGGGSRGGFAPPVGQGFPLSKPSLALSYSFFNFQLKRCLWAFLSSSNGPCSLLSALTKCLHTSITTVITQCGNDLLKLWTCFVFPILIIDYTVAKGTHIGDETHPTYLCVLHTIRQKPTWESELWHVLFPKRVTLSNWHVLIFNFYVTLCHWSPEYNIWKKIKK